MKRIQGKKLPLTAAGAYALRDEYTCTIEPARALAAEALTLDCTLSDLVNRACGLTPVEIELMWETVPARHGHPTTRNRASSTRQSPSFELPTPAEWPKLLAIQITAP